MQRESIERAIDDLKNGKVIMVMDDEGRENEGDFIVQQNLQPRKQLT